MTVKRNAYGRQLGSFHTNATIKGIGEVPMTFIRAPYVSQVSDEVEILSVVEERIVAVRYQKQIALAFHPELDNDLRIHEMFLSLCNLNKEMPDSNIFRAVWHFLLAFFLFKHYNKPTSNSKQETKLYAYLILE